VTDLLKELEAVVDRFGSPDQRDVIDAYYEAAYFIRTHHAEIAEALKDARRYRWLRALPGMDAELAMCPNADGGVVMYQGRMLDERIDAAMHNSAREAGG
jgi:hypothetical protein